MVPQSIPGPGEVPGPWELSAASPVGRDGGVATAQTKAAKAMLEGKMEAGLDRLVGLGFSAAFEGVVLECLPGSCS